VNEWGALHHERLDGHGYPFRMDKRELSLGSRIMAVADVFTAITEDRPYREGMTEERALKVLKGMAGQSLDGNIVSVLEENYDDLNRARSAAQKRSLEEFANVS
jgi:HD-GYP domain-containing protein (c-di-GMP phosphodiesterase class II)